MRTNLAIVLSFTVISCATGRKDDNSSIVKGLTICTALNNESCAGPDLLASGNVSLTSRGRSAAFPEKKSKEIYVSTKFEKPNPKNSFHVILSQKDKEIAASSKNSVSSSVVSQKLNIPEGILPGFYSIQIVSEHGSNIHGSMIWQFAIFPEADIKEENIKVCLNVDSQTHQCESSLKEVPKGTVDFFVTLIHENIVPQEHVSIHINSPSSTFKMNDDASTLFKTDPIPLNTKSITRKIHLNNKKKKILYVELYYGEKNAFEDTLFVVKEIQSEWGWEDL